MAHRKAKVPEMEMTSMAQGSLNTGALNGTERRSFAFQNGNHSEASPGGRARS